MNVCRAFDRRFDKRGMRDKGVLRAVQRIDWTLRQAARHLHPLLGLPPEDF